MTAPPAHSDQGEVERMGDWNWTDSEVRWMCIGFTLIGFGLGMLFWIVAGS